MKKILGLDLGVSSIGWAMISRPEDPKATSSILGMGVRIVPLTSDETDEFTKGQPVTTNQARRMSRGLRRGYYRYRLRKESLRRELLSMGALPPATRTEKKPKGSSKELPSNLESFGLRSKGVTERLSLSEFGKVLYHLNQKRGYKSNRKTDQDEGGKKVSDYLQEISGNKKKIDAEGLTIGQYFYRELVEDAQYRIKGQVFPRACYLQEFDRIWETQAQFQPEVLTEARRKRLRDQIIFFQRPLKSQKGLVSKCTLEPTHRVAPKSSPLFQISKVWEGLNNVTFYDREGQKHTLSQAQKEIIFPILNDGKKLSWTKACKELKLNSRDYTVDLKTKEKGIEANITVEILKSAFDKAGINRPDLLELNIEIVERKDANGANKETAEVRTQVSADVEKQPLYQLWHCIYSIEEDADLKDALMTRFGLTEDQARVLSRIDFTRQGYGSKCARVIRRLLPYLQQGYQYSVACEAAGYNHSKSITAEERDNRPLDDLLQVIKKNELRSPIVEKILNQLIHLVNALIADPRYGRPDEIRIEYARNLSQTKEQRLRAYERMGQRDKENKEVIKILQEHRVPATRKNIEKYNLWKKVDCTCPYSGEQIGFNSLWGNATNVDHIIPQSRLFDDSFDNKIICFQSENDAKGDSTAFDYMFSCGQNRFEMFKERIHYWFQQGMINEKKRDHFLMAGSDIPIDFIERDLRLTSFISKEAANRLSNVCREVTMSSGKITASLRHWWGWDDVLKILNLQQYKEAGLTRDVTLESGAKETRILQEYWTKRDDHRHHAIDALVVACTRQSFVQKLNTLHAQNGGTSKKAIDQWFSDQVPFTTHQVCNAVSGILVSFNSRKRVVSRSKNVVEDHEQFSLAPRGALSKATTVYGKIQVNDKQFVKISQSLSLDQATNIVPKNIRRLVLDRLLEHGNDPVAAFNRYKSNPIFLDKDKTVPIWVVEIPIKKSAFVAKYKLDASFLKKDAEDIVDKQIREIILARIAAHGGKERDAFRDLVKNPIWLNEEKKIPIKTVRCFVRDIPSAVALRYDAKGNPIGFVNPQSNHHIAIYRDRDGRLQENPVTFWAAVKRRQLGLAAAVIKNPASAWDHMMEKVLPSISEEGFLELEAQLPKADWHFVLSLNINEMFVIGMDSEELDEAISKQDSIAIAPFLYRVQNVSETYFNFRRHTETRVDDKFAGEKNEKLALKLKKLIRIQSLNNVLGPIKVTINRLGQIERAKP
jgi:CRISPR-associated endonuclease Csn1